MSDIQNWFYMNTKKQETGPISSEELQDLVTRSVILKKTLVWTEGLPEWVPASKVGGLFEEQDSVAEAPSSTPKTLVTEPKSSEDSVKPTQIPTTPSPDEASTLTVALESASQASLKSTETLVTEPSAKNSLVSPDTQIIKPKLLVTKPEATTKKPKFKF